MFKNPSGKIRTEDVDKVPPRPQTLVKKVSRRREAL
jgi:hypothetical protein